MLMPIQVMFAYYPTIQKSKSFIVLSNSHCHWVGIVKTHTRCTSTYKERNQQGDEAGVGGMGYWLVMAV